MAAYLKMSYRECGFLNISLAVMHQHHSVGAPFLVSEH